MRKRSWLPGIAALALVAGVLWSPAPVAAAGNEGQMAAEIAAHINAERAARGLSRLPVDGSYSAGAQKVAESNRERSCDACHSTTFPSGEVVYWSAGDASGAATVWWMNSPGHRALLMAPDATRLGIGVACSGTEYQAVGWIETDNPPASVPAEPIVSSRSSGSRCQGVAAQSSPTTARPTPSSTALAAKKEGGADQAKAGEAVAAEAPRGGARTTTTTARGRRARGSDEAAPAQRVNKPSRSSRAAVINTGVAPQPKDMVRQLGVELTGRSETTETTATKTDLTPLVLAAVFGVSLLAGWAGRRRDHGAPGTR